MRVLTKKQIIGMILRQLEISDRIALPKIFTVVFHKRLDLVSYEKETYKIRKEKL